MKRVLILTGWCLAIACVYAPAQANAAEHFARHFALDLEEGAAYYSVTLPAAVYAASQRNDLGDLRVLDGAGESVPYALDAPREPARKPPVLRPARWFPLRTAARGSTGAPLGVTIASDGSLRATAAPPGRAQHDTDLIDAGHAPRTGRVNALVVRVRDDNYQGRVTVESSEDLRNWQPAGDAQLLKVSYNGGTLSQDRIELDSEHARYLRLHWLDGSPYVESIDIEVQAGGAAEARRANAQRMWREGIVAHAGPKAGEYFFDTGGPYPIDRLRLNLPQPNTVAPVVVYSRAGLGSAWRQVSSATLYRLHNEAVEQSNPPLELASDTDRQWRVVVDTRGGGLGSGALTVAAGWRPATLTFAARGGAPYTLAVGSAAEVSSAVSTEALGMGASSVTATARVGSALSAEQRDAQSAGRHPEASRRYLLWAALLLAVGSLGAIAWRLARGARAQAQVGAAAGRGSEAAPGGSGAASVAPGEPSASDATGHLDGKA